MGFFDIFKKKQDSAAADIPESRQQQQEELSAGLEKTKTGIFSKLARAVAGRSTVDADLLEGYGFPWGNEGTKRHGGPYPW